jgi:TolB-like protein
VTMPLQVAGGLEMAEDGGEEQVSGTTPPVFISYASPDSAIAETACDALEKAGVTCWIAPRDVTPGTFYGDEIVHAIDAAKAIVLILSQNAATSPHVLREVERAASKRHAVISLRIDKAPLPAGLEYFLNTSQWLDASSGDTVRALPKLVSAVQVAIQGPTVTPTGVPTARAPAPAVSARSPKRMALIVASVVSLALLGFAADRLWLSSHQAAATPATTPGVSAPLPVTATPAIPEKSIAVLPFTDMSEKKDQEYFGDGMAEEILDLLAKIPGLTVIGRTSSFQFKGKNADLRAIGTQLNAAHILEGSVRNSGDRVRITAQLIDTRTGAHEWSETYDRQIGDVLKLQDAIAAAVVRELQLTVDPGFLQSRSTLKNADAYDLMLRGRHAADRWDREGLDEAVALFKQALDRDPTSAEAAAELALTYEWQGEAGYLTPVAAFEQARRAAAIALKLDPKNARAHFVLGLIHVTYDWDWAAAEQEFQQVAVAPGGAYAIRGEAYLSLALGRWDEALRQIKAALAEDPLEPSSFYVLTEIQMRRGYLAEAEAAMRRGLEIRPTYAWGHWLLGLVLLARGDRDAALLEMQRENVEDAQKSGLAIVYYALHRKADSDASLTRLLKHGAESPYLIANVYAFRGESDEALRWLERAYAQKDPGLIYVKVELPLRSLQEDARFKAFLRKMNLPD